MRLSPSGEATSRFRRKDQAMPEWREWKEIESGVRAEVEADVFRYDLASPTDLVDDLVRGIRIMAERHYIHRSVSLADFCHAARRSLLRYYLTHGRLVPWLGTSSPDRPVRRHTVAVETRRNLRAPESSVPSWVPKTTRGKAKWRKVYDVYRDLRDEYYARYEVTGEGPSRPTSSDLKVALANNKNLKRVYCDKVLRWIIKAGDKGWI